MAKVFIVLPNSKQTTPMDSNADELWIIFTQPYDWNYVDNQCSFDSNDLPPNGTNQGDASKVIGYGPIKVKKLGKGKLDFGDPSLNSPVREEHGKGVLGTPHSITIS
jgi:hypothetical protein